MGEVEGVVSDFHPSGLIEEPPRFLRDDYGSRGNGDRPEDAEGSQRIKNVRTGEHADDPEQRGDGYKPPEGSDVLLGGQTGEHVAGNSERVVEERH